MTHRTPRHLYFAYGSNLHREQMLRRCPTSEPVRTLTLKNWKLVFRGVADIVPAKGRLLRGALYTVTAADLAALDRYEGVAGGLYRRVSFKLPEGETCIAYRMNDDLLHPPTDRYYSTIMTGYRNWGIGEDTLTTALREVCRMQVREEFVPVMLARYARAAALERT